MAMGQSAPEENAHATLPVHEMQIRIAALEAELKAEQRLNSELRGDRDRWHEQAQRLALLPPAAPPAQQQGLFSRVFRKSV